MWIVYYVILCFLRHYFPAHPTTATLFSMVTRVDRCRRTRRFLQNSTGFIASPPFCPLRHLIQNMTESIRRIMEEHNLQQNVILPTYKKGHMLDLVVSRISDAIVSKVAIEQIVISDHYGVTFKLKQSTPYNEAQIKEIRDFRQFNQTTYEADVMTKLTKLYVNSDVDAILDLYEIATRKANDCAAPNLVRRYLVKTIRSTLMTYITPGSCAESMKERGGRRVWRYTGKSLFNIGLQLIL